MDMTVLNIKLTESYIARMCLTEEQWNATTYKKTVWLRYQ